MKLIKKILYRLKYRWAYLVTYAFVKDNQTGHGRITVYRNKRINRNTDFKDIEDFIKNEKANKDIGKLVITGFYKL